MGYFSNGSEGARYEERYCSRCVHEEGPCAVMMLHLLHNYDEANNEASMLHELIPRSKDGLDNEQCAMFFEAVKPPPKCFKCDGAHELKDCDHD